VKSLTPERGRVSLAATILDEHSKRGRMVQRIRNADGSYTVRVTTVLSAAAWKEVAKTYQGERMSKRAFELAVKGEWP